MSGKTKWAEEFIYEAVRRKEMQIDSEGRIWRTGKRGVNRWTGEVVTRPCSMVRAEKTLPTGYLAVRAMVASVRMNGLAHRLVWFHFHGHIPKGLEINHKNGDKADNRPSNLELVTPHQNQQHAVRVLRHGRTAHQNGEANHAAKLTDAQVAVIRARRSAGEKLTEIAADYGVAFQTVSRIARGDRRSTM